MTAGSPLLWLDLIRLLNLDIVSGKVKQIEHEGEIAPAPLQTTEHFTSPVHGVSPVSATHLGCVKEFTHNVHNSDIRTSKIETLASQHPQGGVHRA